MQTLIVTIRADQITSRETFHSAFQGALGFFEGYGRNGDAWIDCMTWLDDPESGLSQVTVAPGDLVAIRIDDAQDFQRRCPDLFGDLIEMAAFVNWRRVEKGEPPLLTLLFNGTFAEGSLPSRNR